MVHMVTKSKLSLVLAVLIGTHSAMSHASRRQEPGISVSDAIIGVACFTGAGILLGGIIGGAIGQHAARQEPIYKEKQLKNEKRQWRLDREKKQEKARAAVMHAYASYGKELNFLSCAPCYAELGFFLEQRTLQHHGAAPDAHVQYADDLQAQIDAIEESLVYLYGPEHVEVQTLLAQLQQLHDLYMEFFASKIRGEEEWRAYERERKRERELRRKLKEAQIEREQEEARLARHQRERMQSMEYEMHEMNRKLSCMQTTQLLNTVMSPSTSTTVFVPCL